VVSGSMLPVTIQTGMIDSPLRALAQRRLESLDTVDRVAYPEESLQDKIEERIIGPSIIEALRSGGDGPGWLLEVKKASPSKGHLSSLSAIELCHSFVGAGADALSVLVDSANFGGHPSDLEEGCRAYPNVPFLFKDFVATEYQVRLARALGASSVLLMTQLLERSHLEDLYRLATELKLTPFVETHHRKELEWALDLGAEMIGINARDFSTEGLPVELDTTPKRIEEVGASRFEGRLLVAQSGLEIEEDLNRLINSCPPRLPHAVQIGSALGGTGGPPSWVGKGSKD